ncbi:hypothetical protein SporoP37_10770 [Sporosarcina sp. P37]|uniref:hypothetical protein n=1 Tax=unclassified Sporosarcina TaxID=2647733 RepID=UPI0009C10FB7|nr:MULTISPECIES: hypothetical protein [unclassified Sporosarcina]ARD48577.1 hypothetical protein SporoP33_10355 [Sporosarcina sp. P33]ARK25085.1 hypothetical protein SporoP37_10770 [Sporosarcina sp. P37]PID17925.1 hypothetical protein CSV62_11115 [Sporosarcina sp. P35]
MKTDYSVQGTWIGIVTGIVLAVFLKIVQAVTGLKVYTLLLNVDYIPVIKEYAFPESIEVFFHLIISVVLCVILVVFYRKSTGFIRSHVILFVFLVNIAIGFLLYPTTSFSDRTPSAGDPLSLFWWIAGHGLYGFLAGVLMRRQTLKLK